MTRVGHGFDAHRLVAGRRFVLGGVTIPSKVGPLGHSDGDVLAHAIADALLGACALGDLGGHFPPTDPQWKDADSLKLLAAVHELAVRHGYALVNIDATVIVEEPKLAPYIGDIRERLAEVLAIDITCVSVKAKTSEGMGYTGNGEGIAAFAVTLVTR